MGFLPIQLGLYFWNLAVSVAGLVGVGGHVCEVKGDLGGYFV